MNEIPAIRTTALGYKYSKGNHTINNINLLVPEASIYGFLGPNGSGKTTTLSLLLGMLPLQQGRIEVFGLDFHPNRISILRQVGSLIETPSLYGHLTALENLEVYRQVYGVAKDRLAEVLKIVDLEEAGKKTVGRFSLGMKQRLAIALALLPKPRLLILDEPTNGLDPNGIIELRKLLRKLNKGYGMTILVSSHLLSEVEKMVTHVGIINSGEMLFQGTLQELQQVQKRQHKLQLQTSDNELAYKLLRHYHPERNRENLLVTYNCSDEIASINQLLMVNGLRVYLLRPQENNLEQSFIQLTSSQL
ncbi:MAG: ABC transporter ATP-binding protein [Williamsia sp.]|nr:ABC transporter ATP-binding protein [Williamsia sp.]